MNMDVYQPFRQLCSLDIMEFGRLAFGTETTTLGVRRRA
jgi:hypothetical protein